MSYLTFIAPDGTVGLSTAPIPLEPKLPDLVDTLCTCPECGGSGAIHTVDLVPYGDGYTPLTQAWQCDTCEGEGEVNEEIKYGFEQGWL